MLRSLRPTLLLLALLGSLPAAHAAPTLAEAIASPLRTPDYVQRDRYRHPLETLSFFGLRPDMTVVEIWPGAGWYTEILAPYLRDAGQYYAATPAASLPNASDGTKKGVASFRDKLAAAPDAYDKVHISEFKPPERVEIAPQSTADLVLTFRNVHNWMAAEYEADAFKAFYAALKPGGVLGVVEHRAPAGQSREESKKNGYVTEAYIKALAFGAGFEFGGSSPVNDNPRDTKDYPEGVWTLPPVLRLKDVDRDKYLAIGESDRMTLKFVKPKVSR
ncbi:methyltransferase [uncultured Nevskia sp.]|uniref:class I SAM-dependent methyltransferase n=1 Tax=uncultured Nevskia sp. TaxID=228950 RepID=UPI0025EDF87F|nr:methyltransferase [uncultured Nevskia sp.]